MTNLELAKVYSLTKMLWNNFKMPTEKAEAKLHDEVWFEMLKPFSFEVITVAMRDYCKESEFCNIGKIVALCEKVVNIQSQLQEISENEIVLEIEKAISKVSSYKSHEENQKAFDGLSPIAKKITGYRAQLFRWAQVDIADFETVCKSQIFRQAREFLKKQKEDNYFLDLREKNGLIENKEFLKLCENLGKKS
jgi:hypothetical protein